MNQSLIFVDPEAKIAEGVVIEPFTTVQKNVEIGEGTWIGPNVTIMEGARIGKNCKIYPGAVIAGPPQDLKFDGEETIAVVGDNTVIRECVTVNRGTKESQKTVIGNNCLLMAYVHVAHDCIIRNNCILANTVQLAGHIHIGNHVVVGGATAIHQFVKIGTHAMVAGGALVRKDVPPYTKAGREPLSYCGVNTIGLRRRGFSNEKIHEIQEIYRGIFLNGVNISEAIDKIQDNIPQSEERDEIINFIRLSDRGIMRGYTSK